MLLTIRFLVYLVSIRDDCSLTTLDTLPEIYTSVCFESQTVASNYQKFPNKNSRSVHYGHKLLVNIEVLDRHRRIGARLAAANI